jgi:hypothetical protein
MFSFWMEEQVYVSPLYTNPRELMVSAYGGELYDTEHPLNPFTLPPEIQQAYQIYLIEKVLLK